MHAHPRSKEKVSRRKKSKSPIYVRTKVKELEEQIHKNHKQNPKTHTNTPSPHQQTTQPNHPKPAGLIKTTPIPHPLHKHRLNKHHRAVTPENHEEFEKRYNRVPDNSEEDLKGLREENMRFKEIYSKSL